MHKIKTQIREGKKMIALLISKISNSYSFSVIISISAIGLIDQSEIIHFHSFSLFLFIVHVMILLIFT